MGKQRYIGLKVRLFLAKIGETGEPALLVGQRDATLNIDLAEIETSSKDSEGGWDEVIGGKRSWNISASGAHALGDETYTMMEEALIAPEHTEDIGKMRAYLTTPSNTTYTGQVLITNLSKTAPYQDLTTYSLSLKGDGPLSKTSMPNFANSGTPSPTKTKEQKEVK